MTHGIISYLVLAYQIYRVSYTVGTPARVHSLSAHFFSSNTHNCGASPPPVYL